MHGRSLSERRRDNPELLLDGADGIALAVQIIDIALDVHGGDVGQTHLRNRLGLHCFVGAFQPGVG